jgi:hypothetical protein
VPVPPALLDALCGLFPGRQAGQKNGGFPRADDNGAVPDGRRVGS